MSRPYRKNHVFSHGFVCPAAYQRGFMKQKVCYKYKQRAYRTAYLSSYSIIMQVECCASVISFLQFVNKASGLLLSKLGVITASAPLPVAASLRLFSLFTAPASGYSVPGTLQRDFVCDGG